MKIKASIILLVFINVLIINSNAQTLTLKLWPDGIPGSKTDASYIEKITTTDGRITRCEKVVTPDLTVFLPAPEKANGAAVLICPGGGYGVLAFDHEGNAIARWLNDNGIAGIILKYRLPSDQIMIDKSIGPLQDAQEAMRVIRRNASDWKIDPKKVGVIGFSAGGHLASTISTHYAEKVYAVKDNISAQSRFFTSHLPGRFNGYHNHSQGNKKQPDRT